jgi:hypothetical protein
MTYLPVPMRAVLLAALALAGPLAQAAPRFEITPFAGGRVGGGFDVEDETTGDESTADLDSGASYGLDLGLYANENGFYELLYSRQSSSLDSRDPALAGIDVDVNYLHVGGTAMFPDERFYVPYVSFTLGATFFEPSPGRYDSETRFSASLGGGFRFPVNEHMSFLLGLRGYLTLVDSDTDLFCVSDSGEGGCLLKSSGSTFFQTEAQLGVSFTF